jgi:AraC-like DNA-binding protein
MQKDRNGKYSFTHFKHNPADPFSISSDNVYCVLVDSRKRVWVATYGGGVNLLDEENGKTIFLSGKNKLKGYPIHSCHLARGLAEGANGEIWAGTTEGVVVMKYDPVEKEVQTVVYRKEVDNPASLSNNDILQIFKDSNRNLWFATIGGGINKCTDDSQWGQAKFVSYTVQNGLPSNEINSITEDRDKNIWFSTGYNICSFNFLTKIFSTLSILEGVDRTILSEATAILAPDGKIVFGTLNGYYLIDKEKLSKTVVEAGFKLQITDFQLNEKPTSPRLNSLFDHYIPESRSVTLSDRHAVFSIKFASLNYALQHRIHYQYRLAGYDKEWQNGGVERKATYSNIPAGDYTFVVKAFMAENPEVYETRELQIHIPPVFWVTRRAFAFYTLILTLLSVGVYFLLYRRKIILQKYKVLKIGPSEIVFNDNKDFKFISGLLQWLEKNYTNPDLEIKDMVEFAGLSRTTFYNKMKTLVQMSPIEFISDFRLKKAKMYIEKNNMTIAEITYRTGFNDPVYFTRLFKSKYKITPTECRKQAALSQLETEKMNEEERV